MNDLLGYLLEDAESNIPEREKPEYTLTFFSEFIHSRIEFEPYRLYYEVPYEFRYNKERLCFKCNHDLSLNEDDNGHNYASDELFMEYRLNSLEKESKSNQYWFGYANYLKAIQRNDTTYINQLSSDTYHNNEDFLDYVISVLHSGIGSKNLTRKDIDLIWELTDYNKSFKYEIQSNYNNGDENKRCEYKERLLSVIKSLPGEIKEEHCQNVDDILFTVEDIKTASTALDYYKNDLIEFIAKTKFPKRPVPATSFYSDKKIENLFDLVGKILGDDFETWKQRFVDDDNIIGKRFPNIEDKAKHESNKRLLVAMLGLIDDKNKGLPTKGKLIKSDFDKYVLKKWGLKSFRQSFKANYYNIPSGEKQPITRHSKWIDIEKVI